MNTRRLLSGLYGLAVVAAGIWLDTQGMKLASQIAVITAIALSAPVGVAVVARGFWKTWFAVVFTSSVLFHAVLLWSVRGSLPFSTLGVAILFGGFEGIGLAFAKPTSAIASSEFRRS